MARIVGLDIGGANLKAATHEGELRCQPFPLWQRPDDLKESLRELVSTLGPPPDLVAITMTGELADCFETRHEGATFIIDQVEDAFPDALIRIWMTSSEFAEPDDARELTSLVAAANWHALATWVARTVPTGPAILLDIGSTTTDIIPLLDGAPNHSGATDLERLISGELLYTGAGRTPICAVLPAVTLRSAPVPLAAELFATTLDAHILQGNVSENPQDTTTADGRPATKENSRNRLAHMVCCDHTDLDEQDLLAMAEQVVAAQTRQIVSALERILKRCEHQAKKPAVILSGSGDFLARNVVETAGVSRFSHIYELAKMYRSDVSQSACAFAVARLAAERCLHDLIPEAT